MKLGALALPLALLPALGCTPPEPPALPPRRAPPPSLAAAPVAPPAPPPDAPAPALAPIAALGPLSGRPATCAVVMLHGYGADGADLREVAQTLARSVPDAVFLLPDAPEALPGSPTGRQWFALSGAGDAQRREGVRRASDRLVPVIDRELRARGLSRARLAAVGFSQGAMLALDLGLHMTPAPAGVVSLSGRLADDRAPSPAPAPALIVHGTADARIPVTASREALAALGRMRVRTESLFLPGVGHTIAPEAMAAAGDFLRRLWP